MIKSNPISIGLSNKIRAREKYLVQVNEAAWLKTDKEEVFCILVADGIPLAIAFRKAGFTAEGPSALNLYRQARVQERIKAIIAARAAHPPVSLSEVTDMMKRVYVGAIHDTEYGSAYNAAFGLARLHGLVVDRAQLDVIRRPSREPDAPSEVALSDWIQRLPSLPHTTNSVIPKPDEPLTIEGSINGSDLDDGARRDGREFENTSYGASIIGTPSPGAFSDRGSPSDDEGTSLPRAEDLF